MELKLERVVKVSGEIVYFVTVPNELPKPFYATELEGPNWRNGESSAYLAAKQYYDKAVEKFSTGFQTTEIVESFKL